MELAAKLFVQVARKRQPNTGSRKIITYFNTHKGSGGDIKVWNQQSIYEVNAS